MIHRVGRLDIGETSVAIIVTSAHRRVAFEACHYAIDRLKQIVPIGRRNTLKTAPFGPKAKGNRSRFRSQQSRL